MLPTFSADLLNSPSKVKQKNRLNAMTSPIFKNLWIVSCLDFAWNFEDFDLADKIGVCKLVFILCWTIVYERKEMMNQAILDLGDLSGGKYLIQIKG